MNNKDKAMMVGIIGYSYAFATILGLLWGFYVGLKVCEYRFVENKTMLEKQSMYREEIEKLRKELSSSNEYIAKDFLSRK